jgi:hypothetical protein
MLVFAPSVCVRVCVWQLVVGVAQCETVDAHTPVLILVSQPPFVGTLIAACFQTLGTHPVRCTVQCLMYGCTS